jgi:predicted Zn-dependent peptidase
MLSEGTTTKSGDQLSTELQMLGTTIAAGIGNDSGAVSFLATKSKFEPTLAILADMLLNPAFPAPALDRRKTAAVNAILQQKDDPTAVASMVFPKIVYTRDHPYGRTRTEETVRAVTRDDLVAFHRNYYRPGRAVITVVGDITPAEAKATIERALAAWPAGGTRPDFVFPSPPASKGKTIYIVDKPGAAQSSFALGLVGPPRNTADFYALRVMNTLFGEVFQSRLNALIREQKGWSYGYRSSFGFGRGGGPFRAGGEVRTDATDSALVETMNEIRGIRGDRPVTDDELASAKATLIQSLPSRVETVSGVRGMINEIFVNGLPEDYFQQFMRAVNAVTREDVHRVARQYIDPERMAMVIVGDRAKIEEPLRKTGIAPIVLLDVNGNVVPNRITP